MQRYLRTGRLWRWAVSAAVLLEDGKIVAVGCQRGGTFRGREGCGGGLSAQRYF